MSDDLHDVAAQAADDVNALVSEVAALKAENADLTARLAVHEAPYVPQPYPKALMVSGRSVLVHDAEEEARYREAGQ